MKIKLRGYEFSIKKVKEIQTDFPVTVVDSVQLYGSDIDTILRGGLVKRNAVLGVPNEVITIGTHCNYKKFCRGWVDDYLADVQGGLDIKGVPK